MKCKESWNVKSSKFANDTFNPIRNIVETLKIEPNPEKPMIALSIGDPTVFGNLKPAKEIVDAVVESARSYKYNGYVASTGREDARQAVAEYMSIPEAPVAAKDVILCSGASCALDICISALCDSGSSILVPCPGFPLYTTLAKAYGVDSKFYNLLPKKNWQVDLEHMESLIDDTVSAIVINNPSNPCGSVFTKEHLKDIAALAIKHKIPIIADEIYDHFVFSGSEFHPIAAVCPDLPVLTCGGLTKRFLVPGWRTGWIAIHNRHEILTEVGEGIRKLSQRIIGSNTLVQGALPKILKETPQSFFDNTLSVVQTNAEYAYYEFQGIHGLRPVLPQGAMYMMVGLLIDAFPEFTSDLEFVERLVAEESVFCLPGKCFNIPNYFRVVLTNPYDKMVEACQRVKAFCHRYHISALSANQKAKFIMSNVNIVKKEDVVNSDGEPSEDEEHVEVSRKDYDIIYGGINDNKVTSIESTLKNGCKITEVDELIDEIECE